MAQENPLQNEMISRPLQRSAEASGQFWDHLEIMHPGNPKAQLKAWIERATEHIRAGGPDTAERGEHNSAEKAEKAYREEMVGLCRRAGLLQPDTAADLLILMSEGAKAARQFEGPKEPSDRFRRVAEATVARLGRRERVRTMFPHHIA